MADARPAITPPASVYFVPLVGLRRGQEWRALLGWEIEPARPHPAQKPRWKAVLWKASADERNTISAAFADSFGALPDHLRYVGQWLPTTGVNSATGFDYGKAYRSSLVPEVPDFNQAVLLRWSVANSDDHRETWIEGAVVYSDQAKATISSDGLQAVVDGESYSPLGFPVMDRDELFTARAVLTLTALAKPELRQGAFSYGKLKYELNGILFNGFDTDWNGYEATGPFAGVGRFACNSPVCNPAPALPPGEPGRVIGKEKIVWSQNPYWGVSHDYKLVLSCHTRTLLQEPRLTPEVAQRSHAVVDSIEGIVEGALERVSWVPTKWFDVDRKDGGEEFFVAADFKKRLRDLLDQQREDFEKVSRDGTIGDSVSFVPRVKSIQTAAGNKAYQFVAAVTRRPGGDIAVSWSVAAGTAEATVTAELPRFGRYRPEDCEHELMSVEYGAAWLPRFQGWNGLDVECFITAPTRITAPDLFRRSEGSMTLEFRKTSGSSERRQSQNALGNTRALFGQIRTGSRRLQGYNQTSETDPFLKISAWELAVTSATPYTRDSRPIDLLSTIDADEASDFEEGPVLIQLPEQAAKAVPYILEINEACEPPRVRNLRLELLRDPLKSGELFGVRRFLVLDRTPFLLAQVELPPLARNDGFNSGVVARRVIDVESGQPLWEVALDTTAAEAAIRISLTAQATGEEMVLGTNLKEDRLFNYRFGAPARLHLAPTYNPQRYAPIPWDLRRLFGYPGQRDPGAELRTMEFELLYGLTGRFSAKDAEQRVRVAELFARLGSLVGGLPVGLPWKGPLESEAFAKLQLAWRSVARRFAARLAILQPWSPGGAGELVLTNGMEFQPRMQPGAKEGDPPRGAQISFPEDLLKKVPEVKNLHSSAGLDGGFPFGMREWEAPFYRLFWDNRRSSSAEVRDLAFSSLGGWGQQVARFARNRLLISSRVAMGRTHIYTVERIGKIGVFGHKAKHVIRYERSTVPSPYSLDFPGGQTDFKGRPVLRKMEEYIELLEHRKNYPDQETALPLDTGMVQACFFPAKGTRIPISPTWGRTLEKGVAWEVPLWRSNADPFLYPKPEIFIEMSSGAGDNARPVAQTIANPQEVYFYTTADPKLDDNVSKWPMVPGVDFLPAEEPTEWEPGEAFPEQDNVPDSGWPGAISVPPGFERFTFHLDPAEDEINVVANRRDDVMLHARVRNVTMMRSAPTGKAKTTSVDPNVNAMVGNMNSLRQWQRRAHYGMSEVRSLLLNNPQKATEQLAAALGALNRRLPEIKKAAQLPVAPLPRPGALPLEPCKSTTNPLLARAISWAAAEIRCVLEQRGKELATSAFRPVTEQLEAAKKAQANFNAEILKDQIKDRIDEALKTLDSVLFFVDLSPEQLLTALDQQIEHVLSAPVDRAEQMLDLCTGRLEELAISAEEFLGDATADGLEKLVDLRDRAQAIGDRAIELLDQLDHKIAAMDNSKEPWTSIKAKALELIDQVRKTLRALTNNAVDTLTHVHHDFDAAATKGAAAVAKVLRDGASGIKGIAQAPMETIRAKLLELRQQIRAQVHGSQVLVDLRNKVKAWTQKVQTELLGLKKLVDESQNELQQLLKKLEAGIAEGRANLDRDIEGKALAWAQEAQNFFCPLCNLGLNLPDVLQDGLAAVEKFGAIAESWKALQGLNFTDPKDVRKALDELDALEHRLGVETSWLGREVMPAAREILEAAGTAVDLGQSASEVLRTVRSICNDLRTDGLGLNRKTVAMVLNYRAPTVNLTPTLTKLNQFGKQLGSLGLRLPTTELADRFLPNKDWLPKFDFNRIISDCGGAKLAGLLQRLKMPKELGDHIRVTQGLDKQTLRAWVLADVDAKLSGRQSLFDFGPIRVLLEGANFTAHLRAEIDAGGKATKDASGQILADWVLTTGGQELVAFQKTTLSFHNGNMKFDFDPKNIRLGGLLRMISDLTKALPTPGFGKGSPLKVAWLQETAGGLTVPVGVRATLELPKIDLGTTPVAVTGIQLGGYLELRALQKVANQLVFDFTIAVGFHLSQKTKPFNIAIFCLGGGGWVDAALEYHPLRSDLTADITVGITASASLSFNLGWLSGGVGIYLGLFIEFHNSKIAGSSFSIGLVLVLDGYLDLLGIIEVYLTISLQGVYRIAGGTKTLDCTGRVDVSIKICWCFTLHVSRSFTYSMGGGGSGGGTSQLMAEAVARDHGAMAAIAAMANGPAAALAVPVATDYEALAKNYLEMFARNP